MIGPADVTRWAESLYPNFLRSLITKEPFFPLRRDRLGRVSASMDAAAFHDEVKPLWTASKNETGRGYTVILERVSRRRRGQQNEPVAVVIESRDDYHAIIGRAHEASAFERDVAFVLSALPETRAAIVGSPVPIIQHAGHWPGIVEVVQYLRANPRPGCYVRALPVSVHTKFIEQHSTAIEMLSSCLPETGYDPTGADFTARCGFKRPPLFLPGRFLCRQLMGSCGMPIAEVEISIEGWASFTMPPATRVVVCENKANFLSLPDIPGTIAFWGQGGAVAGLLRSIPWLQRAAIVYWGDMDPSGFAILAHLRRALPHVRSIMMDSSTLSRHSSQLLPARHSAGAVPIEFLTAGEIEALNSLVNPPLGLEQEKLLFSEALASLALAFDIQ